MTCITYSTDYYQRLTLESWFTNLEQTPLNRSQQLPEQLENVDVLLKIGPGAKRRTQLLPLLPFFCGDVDCCFLKDAPSGLLLYDKPMQHFPALRRNSLRQTQVKYS